MGKKISLLNFVIVGGCFVLTACGIVGKPELTQTPMVIQVETTRIVEQTVLVPQVVEVIITATPLPPTPALPVIPTQDGALAPELSFPTDILQEISSAGTPPAAPVASMGNVNFWCVPDTGSGIPVVQQYLSIPPVGAIQASLINGAVEYAGKLLFCQFSYNFNQGVPPGAQLQIRDTSNSPPWLSLPFGPTPENGNIGYLFLTHAMLLQPPVWEAVYNFSISSSAQPTIWTSPVHYDRGWRPEKCWNGTWPNPISLDCPKQQDCHPSDIGYTPMPPGDEE